MCKQSSTATGMESTTHVRTARSSAHAITSLAVMLPHNCLSFRGLYLCDAGGQRRGSSGFHPQQCIVDLRQHGPSWAGKRWHLWRGRIAGCWWLAGRINVPGLHMHDRTICPPHSRIQTPYERMSTLRSVVLAICFNIECVNMELTRSTYVRCVGSVSVRLPRRIRVVVRAEGSVQDLIARDRK